MLRKFFLVYPFTHLANALHASATPSEKPLRLERLPLIPDPLHALEELRPVHQPPLVVDPPVDEVRVIQRQLCGAVDDVVGGLDAEHEAVVLVADLVAPASEAAARVDVVRVLQRGQELLEDALALERRGRVAVVEAAVVGRYDLVLGLDHVRGDEAGDAVLEDRGFVDGFQAGLGYLEHDGPVGAFLRVGGVGFGAGGELLRGELGGGLRLVVGRVVGEDGGAVEGAVVFGEVEPAFVADPLGAGAANANADDVGGGVEEVFAEGDEVRLVHFLDERVDGHGADEFLVGNGLAVLEGDYFAVGVNGFHGTVRTKLRLFLGNGVCYCNPNAACATVGREAESCVGTPVAGGLLEDDVLGHGLQIWSGDTLAEPLTLHLHIDIDEQEAWDKGKRDYLCGRYSPNLEVVRPHEQVGNSGPHHANNPLIEVLGFGIGYSSFQRCVDHAVHTIDLFLLGQH